MATVCAHENIFGDKLTWSFAVPFGSCIYDFSDKCSFVIGWISVIVWTIALLPQIIQTFKTKSVESVSFLFWILWICGDVCNFAGCILTHNLLTNTALAFVYLSLTLIAVLQFAYYNRIEQIRKALLLEQESEEGNLLATIVTDSGQRQKRIMHYGSTVQGSSNLTNENEAMIGDRTMAIDHLAIIDSSPHYKDISPYLSDKTKNAIEFLHYTPRMAALSPATVVYALDKQGSDEVTQASKQVTSPRRSPHRLSPRRLTPQRITVAKKGNSDHSDDNNDNNGKNNANMKGNNKMGGIAGAIITGSTMMSILCFVPQNMPHAESNAAQNAARVLLAVGSQSEQGNNIFENLLFFLQTNGLLFGRILGWLSAIIYISSRIPQLKMTIQTKDVSNLSPYLFILTFLGNGAQCLSMLVRRVLWVEFKTIMSELPWLLSSGLCMFQDAAIVMLIFSLRAQQHEKDKILTSM